MGLLDEMKTADTNSEVLETLRSQQSQMGQLEQRLVEVTEALNRLTAQTPQGLESKLSALDRMLNNVQQNLQQKPQPQPSDTGGLEPVQSRLSEIEKTLELLSETLSGEGLRAATQELAKVTRTASSDSKAAAAAAQRAAAQAEELTAAAVAMRGEAVEAVKVATVAASKTAQKHYDTYETAKARRVKELTTAAEKLEAKQLWTAAGAFALALMPLAAVLLGAVVIVAGVLWSWEIGTAAAEDYGAIRRLVAIIMVILFSLAALFGLLWSWRWAADTMEGWRAQKK